MRTLPVLLPVALAAAGVLVAPSSVAASTEQCTLVVPSKVVVKAAVTQSTVAFGANCAAHGTDVAGWDLVHGAGYVDTVVFVAEEFAAGSAPTQWFDDDPMGRYVLEGAGAYLADGTTTVTQNSPTTTLKYHSRFTGTTKRSSTGALTWSVTAQQWSGRSSAYVGRPKVNVGLFHQAPGSTTWKYVKSATTTSTGKATVSLSAPKSGNYRLKVAETPTVWASYTSAVRGRV